LSTPSLDGDGHSLVIPSELARLEEARLWVGRRAAAGGFGPRAVADLEVAVTEAISNVIRHSYDNDEGQEVHLCMTVNAEKLTITITDSGKHFDRSAQAPVDLDVPHAGGYGLYLIEEIMDEVEWESLSPRGNRLHLAKNRGSTDHG